MNKLGQIAFALAAVGSIGMVSCGGSSSSPDAPNPGSGIDAPATTATVKTVDCTGANVTATVTAPSFAYVSSPAGSASNESVIAIGDIVEFDLTTAQDHPVGPDAASGMTDPGLVAPTGAKTCLEFTAAGDFHYECTVHLFKGTVNVSAH